VRSTIRTAIAAACLLAAGSAARADSASKLVHADSIYKDSRGKSLAAPEGVACAADGTIVVADTGNKRLLRYKIANGAATGGTPIAARKLAAPARIELTSKGEIIALDLHGNSLARIDGNGAFAGNIAISGAPGDAVVPVSFTLDGSDNLYLLDIGSRRVVVASSTGSYQRQIELPADARTVTDIAVTSDGAVYAIGGAEAVLYKAAKGAKTFTAVGKELSKSITYATGLAPTASKASLLAVDQHGNRVVWLGLDGSVLGQRLGMGQRDGFVYYPAQACEIGTSYLVIADRGNDRVQVFATSK